MAKKTPEDNTEETVLTDQSMEDVAAELKADLPREEELVTLTTKEFEEMSQYKKDYLYLQAEYDNFRKRSLKEFADSRKYASEPMAAELLNVLDIFDMALSTEITANNIDSFKQGMDMTYAQFKECLKKFGVEENSTVGEVFNPMIHEAISQEVSDDFEEGHIIKIFKKGYKFFDKTLRPAQVMVAAENKSE